MRSTVPFEKTETVSFTQGILNYLKEFKVLRDTHPAYWGVQIVNLLDCATYFALLTVCTLFLSQDIGLSDQNAGYAVTIFSSLVALMLLFTGFMSDYLGIRLSLWIALSCRLLFSGALFCIGVMPTLPWRGLLATLCLVAMAPSMAMIQTVFQAANKRYTSSASRSAGFNLWYLFMNIGATSAGFLVDIVRRSLGLSNAYVMGAGVITSLLSMITLALLIRTEEPYQPDDKAALPQTPEKPWRVFLVMLKTSVFWRFTTLIVLLLGVRCVFAYMYLLMPKYWIRIMGENAAIGALNAINPILIAIGLIVFIPFANRFPLFKMLVYGAMISSLSLFMLVLPWQIFSTDIVQAHYIMSVLCMIILSIGEVLWSPKLIEYTAAIAPAGQEGAYYGMSMLPWFVAKTLTGAISGHLLVRFVPEGVAVSMQNQTLGFWQSPAAMWLLLGVIAIAGPIIALCAERWFTQNIQISPASHS